MKRRDAFMLLLAGAAVAASRSPRAHAPIGPVEPAPTAPDVALTLHDGRRTSLAALLRGHTTLLQLMFTGCSATCPIQGAVFAALQARLAAAPPQVRLLSVSIDALGDDTPALARWRARFGAAPRWLAAVPPAADVDRLVDFVRGRAQRDDDRHTAQAYLFDGRGRLVYRFAEFADAEAIAAGLAEFTTARR